MLFIPYSFFFCVLIVSNSLIQFSVLSNLLFSDSIIFSNCHQWWVTRNKAFLAHNSSVYINAILPWILSKHIRVFLNFVIFLEDKCSTGAILPGLSILFELLNHFPYTVILPYLEIQRGRLCHHRRYLCVYTKAGVGRETLIFSIVFACIVFIEIIL